MRPIIKASLAEKAKEVRQAASSKDESEKALKEATKLLERLTEIKTELDAILLFI